MVNSHCRGLSRFHCRFFWRPEPVGFSKNILDSFGGGYQLNKNMEVVNIRMAAAKELLRVSEGVRRWQKKQKAKRCSQSALAVILRCDPAKIRSILLGGPRKTAAKAGEKQRFLKVVAKERCTRFRVSKIHREEAITAFGKRHATRLVKPLLVIKKKRTKSRKRIAKKNASELSQEGFGSLHKSSQFWQS